MTIKKAYEEIVELLEANKSKKVESILDQVIELASAKKGGGGSGGRTFVKDAEGNVVAFRCYYLQKWVNPREADIGAKAGTATGLSTMTKYGTSQWTKQQRAYKTGQAALLQEVTNGTVQPHELPAKMAELEAARDEVVLTDAFPCYDTAEECLAAQGLEMPAA